MSAGPPHLRVRSISRSNRPGISVNRSPLDAVAWAGGRQALTHVVGRPLSESVDALLRSIGRPAMTEVEIDFGELLDEDLASAEPPDPWPASPIELVGRAVCMSCSSVDWSTGRRSASGTTSSPATPPWAHRDRLVGFCGVPLNLNVALRSPTEFDSDDHRWGGKAES